MSNKQQAEAPAEVKTEQVKPEPRAPKFTIARLRRDCLRIFKVTASTFDGATFGLKGEYTVEEMCQHLKKWQNKRAVPAKKKEVN